MAGGGPTGQILFVKSITTMRPPFFSAATSFEIVRGRFSMWCSTSQKKIVSMDWPAAADRRGAESTVSRFAGACLGGNIERLGVDITA